MSKFQYNGTEINNIIYGSNATNTTSINNAFTNMTITTNPSSNNYTNINSTPNTFYYSINGVDITTYSIATFVEASSGSTTNMPSWCKNIRAVLIGGGGGSTPSALGTQYDYHSNNSGYNNPIATNVFNRDYKVREHKTTPGNGGGGGAFIYISSLNVTGYQTFSLSCGTGGGASTTGGATTLTISKNSQTSTFTAGGGGGAQTAGAASITNNISATTLYGSGQAGGGGGGTNTGGTYQVSYQGGQQVNQAPTGTGGSGGKDGSIGITPQTQTSGLTYGIGAAASSSTTAVVAGNSGNQGFYRIYYLT
jgi:hypothetical protein